MVVCTCALVCAIVSVPSEWWIKVYIYKYTLHKYKRTLIQLIVIFPVTCYN